MVKYFGDWVGWGGDKQQKHWMLLLEYNLFILFLTEDRTNDMEDTAIMKNP